MLDDRIAGADQNVRIHHDRPRPVFQLPGEAVMHAAKRGLLRIAEVEIGEEAPDTEREAANQRMLDPAEPTHEPGRHSPGDPIGEKEVQVLLLHNLHYA